MVKTMEFQGISNEMQRKLDARMDQAPERRRAREAFKEIQLGIDNYLMKLAMIGEGFCILRDGAGWYCMLNDLKPSILTKNFGGTVKMYFLALNEIPCEGLNIKESYEVNSRGLEIFSKSWLPETSRPKALVCFCHGYGETCTFFFEGIARKLASSGYAVFAMDYPGFGLSEGLHGYISSFDRLVDDVIEHFSKIKENPKFHNIPSFLFGQSMGGAVALKVHLKQPNAWNGAILVAPMCKLADNMLLPWLVMKILIGLAYVSPKLKIVPHKDFNEMAFRDLKKKEQAAYNIIAYKGTARLWTALECYRTSQEIEQRLEEVSLPLLILHGEADIVTDPSMSKALYEKASSSDKKIRLYKDAYHSIIEGEPDEVIIRVLEDIISWLDKHSPLISRVSL